MSAIVVMGAALDLELQEFGIFSLSKRDCEAIIAAVLEKSAAVASKINEQHAAQRR